MGTRTIGIRDLKANISKYLKEVREGKEIKVSYRGKEIALITPLHKDRKPYEETLLVALANSGKILLPSSKKRNKKLPKRKKFSGMPFSESVIEDRR